MPGKKSGGGGRPLLGILVGAAGALAIGKALRRYQYELLSLWHRQRGGKKSGACRRTDGAVS